MEHSYSGLCSVVAVDSFGNDIVVLNQCRNIMVPEIAYRIPAMVPEIVDYQVEIVGEERPERIIKVNRETVAVAHDESRSLRVSMPPQRNDGVVVHADIVSGKRLGQLPYGF